MIDHCGIIASIHPMFMVLLLFFIIMMIIIFKLDHNPKNTYKFSDLITLNGRLSARKLITFLAFWVSTWLLIYQVVNNQFSFEVFVAYIGAWVFNGLASKRIDVKSLEIEAGIKPNDASETEKSTTTP